MAKQTGKVFEELTPLTPPDGSEYLLNLFYQISEGRSAGVNGPAALSWQDLTAYIELMDEPLEPWEVKCIRAMDSAYLTVVYNKMRDDQ